MNLTDKISKTVIPAILLTLLIGVANYNVNAQNKYTGDSVKLFGLVDTLKSKQYQTRQIVTVIESQGVNFRLTADAKKELIAAGARPELLTAIEKNYRPDAKSGKTAAAVTKSNAKSGSYESLIDEAMNKYNIKNDARGAVNTLKEAVALRPNDSRAYQLLGFAYLNGFEHYVEAEKYMSKSIDLGGSAVFRVQHAHDLTFSYSCEGSLYISKNDLRYESDNIEHTFDVSQKDINNVKSLGGWGKFVRRKSGAFKISIRDRKDEDDEKDIYNFSPLSEKKDESKLIIKLIGK